MKTRIAALLLCCLATASSAAVADEKGIASYYGDSLQGNSTASGEPYDRNAMTAAHRTLDFGTRVKVTHLGNGRHVIVRINDRGPHDDARLIDLSGAAAEKLGLVDSGTAEVSIEVVP
jgi:rare lipoprotein A